jgi:hypothetical protein
LRVINVEKFKKQKDNRVHHCKSKIFTKRLKKTYLIDRAKKYYETYNVNFLCLGVT